MEPAVVMGATCMCTMGVAPCTLTVTSQMKEIAGGKPVATIMDSNLANMPSFGMCNSMANPAVAAATAAKLGVFTPAPCARIPAGPWIPKAVTKLVANKPVLSMSCTCICPYGGMIKIMNPGQMKVLV